MNEVEKHTKPLNKLKRQKYQRLTHFVNKELYMRNDFVIEKWVNRRHFLIDEGSLQKFGLTEEFNSIYPYYMIIFFFDVNFWCYDLLSSS